MANILPMEKQVRIVAALAEGSSIRSIERQTEVHRDTIMRLGVRIGEGCQRVLDKRMRNLDSQNIEMDEIWGFIGKKQRNVAETDSPDLGDVWTFIAIDADSKIVPCYRVGKRTAEHANAFVCDLASRLENRIQLSSDALKAYEWAVELGFGCDVDYGQLIKTYGSTPEGATYSERKYSSGRVINIDKNVVTGSPDFATLTTSHIESQNLTVRMHLRRLTRLTNAFSKKLDNFKAAISLHFAYYNFVKRHTSLRMTPAMAAGVAPSFWTVPELIEEARAS
jgi:IS1 family transposase